MKKEINRILNFWFEDCNSKDWFKKDKYFDSEVKNTFGDLVENALFGYINNSNINFINQMKSLHN